MGRSDVERSEIAEHPVRVVKLASLEDGALTDDEGWTLYVGEARGLEFPEGADVEFWGRGLGYAVRGVAVDGQVLFYRTAMEQKAKELERQAEQDRKRREKFEAEREKLDALYEALPDVFKRRIDRFRKGHPDFRWQYEAYELASCRAALQVAFHCQTDANNIRAFRELPYEEQAKAGLDPDLSGNMVGFAIHMALLWATNPSAVEYEHGALTPAVGCVEYGCTHDGVNVSDSV